MAAYRRELDAEVAAMSSPYEQGKQSGERGEKRIFLPVSLKLLPTGNENKEKLGTKDARRQNVI